jgi:hypothetical protein
MGGGITLISTVMFDESNGLTSGWMIYDAYDGAYFLQSSEHFY